MATPIAYKTVPARVVADGEDESYDLITFDLDIPVYATPSGKAVDEDGKAYITLTPRIELDGLAKAISKAMRHKSRLRRALRL